MKHSMYCCLILFALAGPVMCELTIAAGQGDGSGESDSDSTFADNPRSSDWFLFAGISLPFLSSNNVTQYFTNPAEFSIEHGVGNGGISLWGGIGYRPWSGVEAGALVLYRTGNVAVDSVNQNGQMSGATYDLFLLGNILHYPTIGTHRLPIELSAGIGLSVGAVKLDFPVALSYGDQGEEIYTSEQSLFGAAVLVRSGYAINSSLMVDLLLRWAMYPRIEVDYGRVKE